MLPPRTRNVVLAVAAFVAIVGVGVALWYWRSPARVDLARYAPEGVLAFIEIDSLPDLVSGLTETNAWRELAGPLGLSTQLDYAGATAGLLGSFGIGPDDAVILGRAQVAVVITSVEAGAEASPEADPSAATVVIRPRCAIILKTRASESTATAFAERRVPMLAKRAYGEAVPIETRDYRGTTVSTAHGPEEGRLMVWASLRDTVILGNDASAVEGALDCIAERQASLAGNFYLERLRTEVKAGDAVVFAYFSKAGVSKLVGVGPGLVAGTLTSDPDRMVTVSRLVGSVAEGAAQALAYSGSFEGGRFVDRTYALFAPRVDEAVAKSLKPIAGPAPILELIPNEASDVTLVRIDRPGESVDGILTAISGHVDAAVSATLTQIAIEARKSYGVLPDQPVSPMLGNEIAFVRLAQDDPTVAIFEVKDQTGLLGVVERYLRDEGSHVSSETYSSVEILKSSHEDERAAAFVGRYVILGERDQIVRFVDGRAGSSRGKSPLEPLLASNQSALMASLRADADDAADLMLGISGALRATDGSREILERPDIRDAMARIEPAASVTELRNGGVFTETHSAVGYLSLVSVFLGE